MMTRMKMIPGNRVSSYTLLLFILDSAKSEPFHKDPALNIPFRKEFPPSGTEFFERDS